VAVEILAETVAAEILAETVAVEILAETVAATQIKEGRTKESSFSISVQCELLI
jgi:hypothetical protein